MILSTSTNFTPSHHKICFQLFYLFSFSTWRTVWMRFCWPFPASMRHISHTAGAAAPNRHPIRVKEVRKRWWTGGRNLPTSFIISQYIVLINSLCAIFCILKRTPEYLHLVSFKLLGILSKHCPSIKNVISYMSFCLPHVQQMVCLVRVLLTIRIALFGFLPSHNSYPFLCIFS